MSADAERDTVERSTIPVGVVEHRDGGGAA